MDVPPPLRRPRLKKLRTALIATGAVVVALLLAWMPGQARVSVTCGVCGSSRYSDVVGLFWDDDPLVEVPVDVHEVRSSSFIDTLGELGHEHRWEGYRISPERFLADRFVRRTYCRLPRPPHDLHTEAAFAFNTLPALRSRIAKLLGASEWTLDELEDALLWCDDVGCPFSWHDLPQATADRRANAYARLRPILDEFTAQGR